MSQQPKNTAGNILSNGLNAAARAAPVIQTGVAAVAGAAVVTAGAFALMDAASLYNTRGQMASQYQQESMFPEDLVQPGVRNFYVSFKFQKYVKRSINNSPFLRSEGTIRLPLPGNLKDNMSVNYDNAPLGAAVGAALDNLAGSNLVESDISATTRNLGQRTASALASGLQGTAAELVTSVGGQGYNAASAYFGVAVNPYQTVLFKQPDFKSHSFSWKLMPKNEYETGQIRDIIRTFQYHMSPGVSENNGLFFSYPSMALISLFPESDFLYRFKPCVVKNVSVDYASGSAPSFFKSTKAPTSITLSIQLQEIEYWTNRDFDASSFNDNSAIAAGIASLSSQQALRLSAGSGDNNRVTGQGQGQ
jgi:hypothetical protein